MSYFKDSHIHTTPEFTFDAGTPANVDCFDSPSPNLTRVSIEVPPTPAEPQASEPVKPGRHVAESASISSQLDDDKDAVAETQEPPPEDSSDKGPKRGRNGRATPFTPAPILDLSGATNIPVVESSLLYRVRKMVSRFGELFT
jgi:hypothetical protein